MKAGLSPFWRVARRRGRAIGLVCVLAYLIGVTGAIPLPDVRRLLSSGGEAYPCQGHNCGCASEQDCREHCCCFTPAELLAWSKRQERAAVARTAGLEGEGELCGTPADEPARSCCSEGEHQDVEDGQGEAVAAAAESQDEDEAGGGWGFGLSPLGCKSVELWLLVAVPFCDSLWSRAVPPPPRLIGLRRGPRALVSDSLGLDVPVPPPRR